MTEESEDTTRQKELFSDLSELGRVPENYSVLLVEPVGRDMAGVRAMIRTALPGYDIKTLKNSICALDNAGDGLSGKVAMIIDASGCEADESLFSHKDFPVDLSGVPIVTQNTQLLEGGKGDDDFLQKMGIDGVIDSPTTLDAFRSAIAGAARNRVEFCEFQRTEEEVQKEVLSHFVDYVEASLIEWKLATLAVSSDSAEIKEILEDIDLQFPEFEILVDRFSAYGPSLSIPQLSRIAHDMNNKLAVLLGNLSLVPFVEDAEEDTSDKLKALYLSIKTFSSFLNAIMKRYNTSEEAAFNTQNTWSALKNGELEPMPDVQKLELPEGCNVCVVDDDSRILDYCSQIMSKSGGNYFEAGNAEALEEWGQQLGMDGVDVFLLDNDLEGDLMGHELIPLLKALFPGALIIAHTGDTEQLRTDPNNPYTREGIEIAGKLQWNEVNRILKEKGFLTE